MSPASAAGPASVSYSAPFDALAEVYDELFTHSVIGRVQRDVVWKATDETFRPGQRILEINCATGTTAMHLGSRGVSVLACDVSPRMTAVALQRAREAQLRATPEFRILATEGIPELGPEGPFDGVLSNFGGLNCVEDLRAVARDLARLLRPGAPALLCFLGLCCAARLITF